MSSTSPLVSIIVPCRDEEKDIAACLDGVVSFDYPHERMEVIVVDGLSSDSTKSIVRKYCDKYKFVRLLENPGKTAPSAMNTGVKVAKGEFVARLDAHSEYPRDYLRSCLDLLIRTGAGNAGGRVVNVPNGFGVWAVPISFVTGHVFGVGNGAFRVSNVSGFVDTVPFGTFRRQLFEEVGYYDERLTRNQDNEFNDRLRRAGFKIAFDPQIAIRYKNQAMLEGLLRQGFFTGMWNVYTLALYPYTFKWRRFIPAGFVAYLISLPILLAVLPRGRYSLLPGVLYLALTLAVSFGADHPLAVRMRIMATFFTYHISYGLGTWMGVINVIVGRWRDHLGKPLLK